MLKNIILEVEATAADYNLTINVTLPSKTQKSLVVFSDHGITQFGVMKAESLPLCSTALVLGTQQLFLANMLKQIRRARCEVDFI